MSSIEIIPMTKDDMDNVLEIERLSFPSPWSRELFLDELANPLSHSFIAKQEVNGRNTLLGFACFWIVAGEAHILNIAVHPEFRRHGVGRTLLAFVLKFSKNKGAGYFSLEVRNRNRAAIEFYKGFGFREAGLRKGYYADTGEDAVIMELGQL